MGLSTALQRPQIDGKGRDEKTERLGGARADFAANLGRRAAEIGALLDALAKDAKAARPRDDLRRRVHALSAGAKLLRFRRLGVELRGAEERLDAAAKRAEVTAEDVAALRTLVGSLADLAWGGGPAEDRTSVSLDDAAGKGGLGALRAHDGTTLTDVPRPMALTALVVGTDALAKTLSMPDIDEPEGAPEYEIERTYDAPSAIDLARALAPDVIVIDADLPAAKELVEALMQDPLVENIPTLIVGRFARPEDAGPFLALGVAKTLPKPVSPGALREACKVALSAYGRREAKRDPLGHVRIDELGARLAEELRRGLCDAAEGKGRNVGIELGEGTEVLAALWGAVARIRDVVTIRSQGAVRFAAGGPEGALPFAPWLGPEAEVRGSRGATPSRGAKEGSLERCSIVVADDDPSVTWFLAGVLKAAGATVYEAKDGARALEIAKHRSPDLIITDILMPHLDGFSLCRALKRDVVLRDAPVVLLSWKEDLLQRVRELGVDADGYLRKEVNAGVVVQRVRELLHQRRRVRERVAAGGEVRGRLDGLSAATLLRFACELRPCSTLSLRDATFLYELEIRRGRPVRATRTALDGTLQRGSSVLASLLATGDGRFVITPAIEAVGATPRPELEGDLQDQLLPLVAAARAAQSLVSGENLVRVDRVGLEEDRLAAYLASTPEPSRALLRGLARGASPRAMIVEGRVAPQLLESILVDAGAHGAIFEVLDEQGNDRMPAGIACELALLRGERKVAPIPEPLLPEPAEPSALPPIATPIPAAVAASLAPLAAISRSSLPPPPEAKVAGHSVDPEASPPPSGPRVVADAQVYIPSAPPVPTDLGPIASPSPSPAHAWLPLAAPPSSSPRSIPPSPPVPMLRESPTEGLATRASSPPPSSSSAKVASSPANDPTTAKREAFGPKSPLPARAVAAKLPAAPPGLKPMLSLGSLTPPPVQPTVTLPAAAPPSPPKNTKSPKPPPASSRANESPAPPDYDRRRFPLPSMFAAAPPLPAPKKHTGLWIAFAVVGVVFAVWARSSRQKIEEPPPPALAAAAEIAPPAEPPPAQPDQEAPPAAAAEALRTKGDDGAVEELPLRKGDKVKKGNGLLEVVAGKSDSIYIDGKAMGSGPIATIPLKAKDEPYELKVKQRGEERVRKVVVHEGRMTRVRLAPPWQR